MPLRWIFAVAVIPAVLSVLVILRRVKEHRAEPRRQAFRLSLPASPAFRWLLAGSLVFAVGNSSDMFILLKAKDVGLSTSLVILLYVLYNVVYAGASLPLGGLSDRVGQYRVVLAGYALFAAVYLGFAAAGSGWTLAALFAAYGLYIAATEGTSKALVGRAIPCRAARLGPGPVLHGHRARRLRRQHRRRPAVERVRAVGDVRVRGGGGPGRRRPHAARARQRRPGAGRPRAPPVTGGAAGRGARRTRRGRRGSVDGAGSGCPGPAEAAGGRCRAARALSAAR